MVRTLTRCRTGADNARSVARALIARRSRRAQGPRPVAACRCMPRRPRCGRSTARASPIATHPRPGLIAIDAGHGFAFPAIELAEARTAATPRAARGSPRRRSATRVIAAPPAIRSSGWPSTGLVALMFVNTPGAMAPWGGSKAGVRHQPDRLRLSAAGPRAAGDRSVAVEGGARQRHDGEAARRANPRRLGARRRRASRPPIRTRRCAARCCRWATPRAPRWR